MAKTSASGGDRPTPAGNVEVLKALADPVRMNLLYALTRTRDGELPVMSVKELAAALGEPQTKLYRHVKTLEAAGLIHAAASRVVSGIVEQRYRASRADLMFGDDLSEAERTSPEAEAMTAAALEMFRRQFFASRRAMAAGERAEADSHGAMLFGLADGRLPAARAAEIRAQLRQIFDEICAAQRVADQAGTEPLSLLIGFFSPQAPA